MKNQSLIKLSERLPFLLDDTFRPWNDYFEGGLLGRINNIPPVNVTELKNEYKVSLAAPGLKKSDFKIDVDGNLLTISSEKEETKEEKDKRYNRREYNYSSFSRSFTLPEGVLQDKIEARYEDGVLKLSLPKKEEAKKATINKHIAVK